MKRLLIITAAVAVLSIPVNAQDNSNRIGIGAGAAYPLTGNTTLFWEHETRYHNAWEVYATGSLSGFRNMTNDDLSWGVGAAWKQCIFNARNRYGSMRFGASLGAARKEFRAVMNAGWQHTEALRRGRQFYWQVQAGVSLPKRDRLFHIGATVGVKMPVCDRMQRNLKRERIYTYQ